jgi:hypothetical protein
VMMEITVDSGDDDDQCSFRLWRWWCWGHATVRMNNWCWFGDNRYFGVTVTLDDKR